jgi:hypothetical protein
MWLFRVRDAAAVAYWRQKKTQLSEPVRIGLSFVDAAIGVGQGVAIGFSTAYEAKEGPPTYLTTKSEKDAWTSALFFKTLQNASVALNLVIAPAPLLLKPPYGTIAKGVRVGCAGSAAVSNFVVAGLETGYDFVV